MKCRKISRAVNVLAQRKEVNFFITQEKKSEIYDSKFVENLQPGENGASPVGHPSCAKRRFLLKRFVIYFIGIRTRCFTFLIGSLLTFK